MMLSGSSKQFSVGYDTATKAISLSPGQPYTPIGGELTSTGELPTATAIPSPSTIQMNGEPINLTVYSIGGSTYVRLSDIGKAIDFGVFCDNASNTIRVDTAAGYREQAL
jgi:hypothetical protein